MDNKNSVYVFETAWVYLCSFKHIYNNKFNQKVCISIFICLNILKADEYTYTHKKGDCYEKVYDYRR